jgi:hypothetical protein
MKQSFNYTHLIYDCIVYFVQFLCRKRCSKEIEKWGSEKLQTRQLKLWWVDKYNLVDLVNFMGARYIIIILLLSNEILYSCGGLKPKCYTSRSAPVVCPTVKFSVIKFISGEISVKLTHAHYPHIQLYIRTSASLKVDLSSNRSVKKFTNTSFFKDTHTRLNTSKRSNIPKKVMFIFKTWYRTILPEFKFKILHIYVNFNIIYYYTIFTDQKNMHNTNNVSICHLKWK